MNEEQMQKAAHALAVCAVTGDRKELEKQAAWPANMTELYNQAQPYLRDPRVQMGLAGAGAGGLLGLLQPRRKMQNALTYGLLGGMGGAGLAHAFGQGGQTIDNIIGKTEKAPAKADGFKEHPNFTSTFNDAPVIPSSPGRALQQVATVLNHPVSALNKVRELADDPDTYKGIQSEYINPVTNAVTFPGRMLGTALGTTYTTGKDLLADVNSAREAVRDAHMERMQNLGENVGTTYGNAVAGVQNAVRDASNFREAVRDAHTQRMQSFGEKQLYPAAKALYDAPSAVSNWWNGRR